MKNKVERLKQIKDEMDKLGDEKLKIEESLDDMVIYENGDGTWTRFTKIDNVEELKEGKTVFRSHPFNRYSTKLETLKNPPKELKQINS